MLVAWLESTARFRHVEFVASHPTKCLLEVVTGHACIYSFEVEICPDLGSVAIVPACRCRREAKLNPQRFKLGGMPTLLQWQVVGLRGDVNREDGMKNRKD